jgi:mRNA-degrading endonuclease toxin of MazEF toxin-antitoxin module
MPLKGEVWDVDLEPAQGHGQASVRPCVVISNNLVNTKMGLSIIVPFTGTPHYSKSGKLSPAMVAVFAPEGGLNNTSYSMAYQVLTVSHKHFLNKRGTVSNTNLTNIVRSVQKIIDF